MHAVLIRVLTELLTGTLSVIMYTLTHTQQKPLKLPYTYGVIYMLFPRGTHTHTHKYIADTE